ncbi:MAG: phosphatase PAP2 family protein [Anaerolineae bacterium]|nr:phosphatase PAP2 family protein [Anaerolineae bacterium]
MGQLESGWGLQVILWFQSWRTPLVESIALLFHYTGSVEFALVFIPLIYWCVDERFGRRLMLFFSLNGWVNGWLKEWWHRPRPFQVSDQVRHVVPEASYGIPSGHTQNATALWGPVALNVRRHWATIAVTVYVILMGISRMVLGVHFPQDVIAGAAVGLLLVGLYAWLEAPISAWINKQGLWTQIGVVIGVTAAVLAIHPGLIRATSIDEANIAVTSAGAFLGGGIGIALETRHMRFSTDGTEWKRLARFLLGVTLLMGLRYGLKALFDGLEPAMLFRLIRYALLGFLTVFGAPWIFVKSGLAERRTAGDA